MQERIRVECPDCKGVKHLRCELCQGNGCYKIDHSLEDFPTLDISDVAKEIRATEVIHRAEMMEYHQYA